MKIVKIMIKFSILSNVHIVDIEYPEGICSPSFAVDDVSGLFLHPSTFLIKDKIQDLHK